MIAEAFLNVWYAFINWLFGLIPEFSLPDVVVSDLFQAVRYIRMINDWIPVDTFVILVPIVISFWILCAVASAVLQLL